MFNTNFHRMLGTIRVPVARALHRVQPLDRLVAATVCCLLRKDFAVDAEPLKSLFHDSSAEGLKWSLVYGKPLMTILMPVYNTKPEVLRESIESVLCQAYKKWEFCIVDDASTMPHVRSILEIYARKDPRIRLQFSGSNQGIAAKKTNRSSDSFLSRGFAHVFNKLMNKTTGMDFSGASDYIFMDRDVVNAIISTRERVRFFRGLAKWTGFSQIEIPFEVLNRLNGTSKWPTKKLISLLIDAMTGFTYQPLIWVFGSGIIGLVIFLLLGIQALYSWIMDIAISGWTSLTVIILFFGSANLLSIGIVGLYLARIFDEVKLRPHFIIQEVTNKLSKKMIQQLTMLMNLKTYSKNIFNFATKQISA